MLQTNYPINLKRQQLIALSLLSKYGVNGFITSKEDIAKEFFKNVTNILYKKYKAIPFGYNAESLWYTDGRLLSTDEPCEDENRAYFHLDCYNSQYKQIRIITQQLFENNKECLRAIIEELADLAYTIKEEQIKNEKQLPQYDDMLQIILHTAQKIIDKTQYSIDIEKGKLNLECNLEPYKCLVLRSIQTKDYISSIVLGNDNFGRYVLTHRKPLCGEGKIIVSMDNIEMSVSRVLY